MHLCQSESAQTQLLHVVICRRCEYAKIPAKILFPDKHDLLSFTLVLPDYLIQLCHFHIPFIAR